MLLLFRHAPLTYILANLCTASCLGLKLLILPFLLMSLEYPHSAKGLVISLYGEEKIFFCQILNQYI